MSTNSWLSTYLDIHMLERRGTQVAAPSDFLFGREVPTRTGEEVAAELGGRLLVRYLAPDQVGRFRQGSRDVTYTTPTSYTPEEAVRYLMLPNARIPREHALLLDPTRIGAIQGPMMVAHGRGIQYILPDGFPEKAIVVPGAPGARWEIAIS